MIFDLLEFLHEVSRTLFCHVTVLVTLIAFPSTLGTPSSRTWSQYIVGGAMLAVGGGNTVATNVVERTLCTSCEEEEKERGRL